MQAEIHENRWYPRQGELAAEIEIKTIRGWLWKDLIVEEGQLLLLSADGRNLGEREAESILVGDFGDRIARAIGLRNAQRCRALLFSKHSFTLTFDYDNFFTRDPYQVGLSTQLVLKIENFGRFRDAFLRGRAIVTENDVSLALQDQIANFAQNWLNTRTIQQLAQTAQHRIEWETELDSFISQTLTRYGLTLLHLQTLNYRLIHQDRLNQTRQEYLIKRTAQDTKLQGERELFDLVTQEQLLQIQQETREVEQFERRAAVRDKMRRAVNSDTFAELTTQQEKEQFLRKLDQEKLLHNDEWQRFQRTLNWRNDDELHQRTIALEERTYQRRVTLEDRDRERIYLLNRLDIEKKFDLQLLQLQQRQQLEPQQLAHQQAMALLQLENEQTLVAAQQTFNLQQRQEREAAEQERLHKATELRLEQQRLEDIARREREREDEALKLQTALGRAKTQAEIDEIERQQDQLDAEMGLMLLEKMKAVRRQDEMERDLHQWEMEQRREEARLKREEAEFKREMTRRTFELEQFKTAKQFELDWADKLRGMAPAELILMAGDQQRAELIVQLQRTETMAGMTEQKILAMMAENSPQAAQALIEMAKASQEGRLGPELRAMYERLFTQEQEKAKQREDEIKRMESQRRDDSADRQAERDSDNRKIDTLLRGMAGIEAAKPTSNNNPIIVNNPSGGGMGYVVGGGSPTGGGGAVLLCPSCGTQNQPAANHCNNCGFKLRGG